VQIPGREVVDVVNFHRVRDPSYFPVFRITHSPRVSCKHVTGGALREMRRERRGRRPLMKREREKERERERERERDRPKIRSTVSRQCCFRHSQRRDTRFECYASSVRAEARKSYYNDKPTLECIE